MRQRTVLFLIMMAGFAVSAETFKLSGTISNQSGKPIRGAIVSLMGQTLLDTTDVNGAYSFSNVMTRPYQFIPHTENISMKNGSIQISLTKPAQVRIDMFDMAGNLLKKELNHYASAGEYRYDIINSPSANNMAVVRVSIGERSSTFRYLVSPDGRNSIVSTSVLTKTSAGGGLARIQANVDSLQVSATSYIRKVVPVSSYIGEVNITIDTINLPHFSFFVTSLEALQELSGSENGFGGDLRFGKTGQGAGLLGADSICQCIAEKSMPGSKVKIWRAFLSASKGVDGKQVNAIDRIGNGPWYDRRARMVAKVTKDLLKDRPDNCDDVIVDDLPNESGTPNHRPDPNKPAVDNHLTVTGTGADGKLYSTRQNCTCDDWTSTTVTSKPRAGLSWPRGYMMGMQNWISVWDLPGCKAGYDLEESTGAGKPGATIIGSGGGYGGFYCFALNP